VLVTLLSVIFAIIGVLGIYCFIQIKRCDEYKKDIDEKVDAIKKSAAAIEERKNNAEMNVDTLRVDIEKSIPHSFYHGYSLFHDKHYDLALKNFEDAIEKNPDSAEAWCFKGVALENLEQADNALKAYENAIKFKPNYAGALYELARAYYFKGEKEKALSNFKNLIE
jgi:tetratricopeptide (TPR) repeat protein